MRKSNGQFAEGAPGRPRGVRNKLASQVFADVLAHWNEPVEGRNISKGLEALETMYKEKAHEYVRAVLSLMPRELAIENVMAGASVDDIEELMAKIRDVLLVRETPQHEPAKETEH
jgi:hypothetical protein